MKPDPGLEPTRAVRERISREHGNDPRRPATGKTGDLLRCLGIVTDSNGRVHAVPLTKQCGDLLIAEGFVLVLVGDQDVDLLLDAARRYVLAVVALHRH